MEMVYIILKNMHKSQAWGGVDTLPNLAYFEGELFKVGKDVLSFNYYFPLTFL